MLINHIFSSRLQIQHIADNDEWKRIIYTLDGIFCSTIIPGSYVLKSDEIKKVVISGGWCKPLRLLAPICMERVSRDEQFDMAPIANAQPENIVVQALQEPYRQQEDDEA